MGPVAVQCGWSMHAADARRDATSGTDGDRAPEQREMMWRSNLDTCHVWAADGEQVASLQAGRPIEVMLTLQRRFEERGVPPEDWPTRF